MTPAPFTFELIRAALPEARLLGPASGAATAVSTDTRTLKAGELFVALVGDAFDGHRFVSRALDFGAAAVVVSKTEGLDALLAAHPRAAAFAVADTLAALGALAAHWRSRCAPRVLAVSGSNGKTTTKEILAAILRERSAVLATTGNLNNLVGLPLTLLALRDEPVAVVEFGVSIPGEMAQLAAIARPDVGVVTSIHPAHLQDMGDIETVAREKGGLFAALAEAGVAVVNLDDPRIVAQAARTKAQRLTFSRERQDADVCAQKISPLADGFAVDVSVGGERAEFRLPLLGRHNVSNLLAAVAAAHAVGAPLASMPPAVAKVVLPGRRLKIRRDITGFVLIDDCYNANPASMAAALDILADVGAGKHKTALLGDMLELGPLSADYHRALGEKAAQAGVDLLGAFGRFAVEVAEGARRAGMPEERIFCSDDWSCFAAAVDGRVRPGGAVLVKGSRGMRMERAIDALAARTEGTR
ncbi:MAG: UDP-N-acetylmuramoyl-tripeptide--D-alanyl-D-alanine ligase [Myxococcales bacterium]|nr:MAG: UDP-N-acetylmuramoyl-tripeptide--D-alanyl-D-alanine ligase [Myxococcales bacterium]